MSNNFTSLIDRLAESFSNVRFAFKNFRNPFIIFPLLLRVSQQRSYTINLKKDFKISLRPCRKVPVCDLDILKENLEQDQYQLDTLVKKGDTVVDIGAHIGIFSVMASRLSEGGKVLAFEPEASNYRLLERNIILNSAPNLNAFNKAVTSSGDDVRLHISNENKGAHSLLGNGNSFQQVSSTTLPGIIDTLEGNNINLLKLDCEGSEYGILLNTSPQYLSRIDKIIMEVHETPYTEDYKATMLYDYLRANGFHVRVLHTITYESEGVFFIVYAARE